MGAVGEYSCDAAHFINDSSIIIRIRRDFAAKLIFIQFKNPQSTASCTILNTTSKAYHIWSEKAIWENGAISFSAGPKRDKLIKWCYRENTSKQIIYVRLSSQDLHQPRSLVILRCKNLQIASMCDRWHYRSAVAIPSKYQRDIRHVTVTLITLKNELNSKNSKIGFVKPTPVPIHMMTSSNGNSFRVTGLCAGNSPVTGEFPSQRPVTWNFDISFDQRLNKR